MTTTELLALANKALEPYEFEEFKKALNEKRFTHLRNIAEKRFDNCTDKLIEEVIEADEKKVHIRASIVPNYKNSMSLLNETLDFVITNSEVN